MIIKQNEQYQLHATLTPYKDQQSLVLSQVWPQAQHPNQRQILQVVLDQAELEAFGQFLSTGKSLQNEEIISELKPGTLCMIVGGSPENTGLVVKVVEHMDQCPPKDDAYLIRTLSGRPFPQHQTGSDDNLPSGSSNEVITDRHKLQPLSEVEESELGSKADRIKPVEKSAEYPHLVVRFMSTVYQRESIQIRLGAPAVYIGYKSSFVQHPDPFTQEGQLSEPCRALLLKAVQECVAQTRFRMCLVWAHGHCSFVELDGRIDESGEPPSGGVPLPQSLNFEKRGQAT